MALFDRNQRQRSSCGSTATIVLFVAICLLGLWMMSSPQTVPAATSVTSSSEKVRADVKEEDSSIDATNTVKQDSANIVAETTTTAAAVEKGDGGKTSSTRNQSFDDENGTTEGGNLVKPGAGETDGGAAQGKTSTEEAAAAATTDVKDAGSQEQTPTDTTETVGDQDKNADQTPTDTKETAATTADAKDSDAVVSGSGPKKQTFDDENGKMDGVDLVKDDGNKTLMSEENAKVDGAVLTVKPLAETAETTTAAAGNKEEAAASAADTTATTTAEPLPNVQAALLTERAAQNGSFTTQAAESM